MNYVDDTAAPKIPAVSYEIEVTNIFGDCLLNNLGSRPLQTLDNMFERQMKKRLNMFHARPIDRTQYDKDILNK